MKTKYHYMFVKIIILGMFLLFLVVDTSLATVADEKFLLIHLDGVSSKTLFDELQMGSLPNLAEVFAGGQRVEHGLSIFVGETPLVLTRIREGLDYSKGVAGWAYVDREKERTVKTVAVFLQMMGEVARVSRSQFVFQYPVVNHLSGLSLLNLDRLWDTHNVVEFYWINSDTAGHSHGLEGQLKSLRRFDYYLGLAAKKGHLEGVNVLLYTDHGLSMDDVKVVQDNILIKEVLQEELRFVYYPNVFLHNPAKKEELAERIAKETAIDLALLKESTEKVIGFSSVGMFEIRSRDDTYQYQHETEDYFGYDELGYQGEFLTKEAWLQLTKEHLYPGAPPNLFMYLQHPHVGDTVTVINAPQIPYYNRGPKGHHGGLTSSDLLVALLYTGDAFQEVEPFEEFWLYELFSKHFPMVDFTAKKSRENHTLTINYPLQGELIVSPAYRWRAGLSFDEQDFRPWLEYDLYSSFLTRFWGGVVLANQSLNWRLKAEAHLGDFGLSWLKQANEPSELSIHLRFHKQGELVFNQNKIGVSFFF